MKKTKVFALSILSINNSTPPTQKISQTVWTVKATSKEEAIGKGVLEGLKSAPLEDGWHSPSVLVSEIYPEWFNDEEESDED